MRKVAWVGAALLLALGASRAGASVIFNDNFDGETVPAGSWVMNDAAFANFNVASGSVDLLTAGNPFGLVGSGTNLSGNFVDLAGSTGQGGTLVTKQTFGYSAGHTVTVSFDVSGDQRGGTDGLFGGFQFASAPAIADLAMTGFTSNMVVGDQVLGTAQLGSTAAFAPFTVSFRALTDGSFTTLVGTNSADNIGPLLDDVSIAESLLTGVPEPQSWALMILGFAGAGAMLRRRPAVATSTLSRLT
ncbi:MAG TPA: PEPxxWA-CTERM sorting domain-containing protein [Phenylobacterium sp.]|jgi:hypothetical protein|nr:PEPxxWA-CTERM sorting domain-containing protein [Phenylobacterium sp.]